MKKFLIATTALTLSAGVAAAEVKLSGDGRFGIQYDGSKATNKTVLEKRLRFNLDASTTTDAGVTLGGRIRITSQEEFGALGGADSGTRVAGARVFAQYGGLTVAVGNILGAVESFPGFYGNSIGLTGLGYYESLTAAKWDAYTSAGKGAEGIEVMYTMGAFKGHISYSSNEFSNSRSGDNETIAAYGAYTFGDWTVGLVAQEAKGSTTTPASAALSPTGAVVITPASTTANPNSDLVLGMVAGTFGDYGVNLVAGKASNVSNTKKETYVSLSGSATFGATKVSAFVADWKNVWADPAYGLGAQYNLGGGASVVGGVVRTPTKDTRADIGVSFRF